MHSSVHDIRPCRCQSLVVHLGTSYGFFSDTCCDLLCRSTCIHLFILSVIRIGTVRLLFPLISRCSGSFSKSFSTSLRDVSSSVFGFAVHLGFYSFNRILETSPCHFLLKVITFANTTWSSVHLTSPHQHTLLHYQSAPQVQWFVCFLHCPGVHLTSPHLG